MGREVTWFTFRKHGSGCLTENAGGVEAGPGARGWGRRSPLRTEPEGEGLGSADDQVWREEVSSEFGLS